MDNKTKIIIGIVALLTIITLGGILYLLLTVENLATNFRDLLIIILAIESMMIGMGLLLMLWEIYKLIVLLREEVMPLIHSTKQTVEQIQHTTTFIGQSVAEPVISTRGFLTGAKAMIDTLRGQKEPHELLQQAPSEIVPTGQEQIMGKEHQDG
jgi:hypothetical protein